MNFKAIFLIGILLLSFLTINSINATTLSFQSQIGNPGECVTGIIEIRNLKDKKINEIQIEPGQTVNIEITKDIGSLKFRCKESMSGQSAYMWFLEDSITDKRIYNTDLTSDQCTWYVWFYYKWTWDNKLKTPATLYKWSRNEGWHPVPVQNVYNIEWHPYEQFWGFHKKYEGI